MTNEQKIINNHIAQLKIIQEAINSASNAVEDALRGKKEDRPYIARCRKCGNEISLDAGEEGRCQYCL